MPFQNKAEASYDDAPSVPWLPVSALFSVGPGYSVVRGPSCCGIAMCIHIRRDLDFQVQRGNQLVWNTR